MRSHREQPDRAYPHYKRLEVYLHSASSELHCSLDSGLFMIQNVGGPIFSVFKEKEAQVPLGMVRCLATL